MSIILKQSPLPYFSSINPNKNVLKIDGELSELMCTIICDELNQTPQITCLFFANNISIRSLQFIITKVALIDNISDLCFEQGYTIEILSLVMIALNASSSKKTIWTTLTDIGKQKVSVLSKNSLVTISDGI